MQRWTSKLVDFLFIFHILTPSKALERPTPAMLVEEMFLSSWTDVFILNLFQNLRISWKNEDAEINSAWQNRLEPCGVAILRQKIYNQVSAFGGTSWRTTNSSIMNYEYLSLKHTILFICVLFNFFLWRKNTTSLLQSPGLMKIEKWLSVIYFCWMALWWRRDYIHRDICLIVIN